MNTRGFKRFEEVANLAGSPICWHFDKAAIVANDKLPFLEFWNVPRIAASGCLHQMRGRMIFAVSGYDHDERSIFEIPETKKFLMELANEWPFFFYADALLTPFLCDLIKCMQPALTVIVRDSDPANATAQVETEEVNKAYRKLLDGNDR